MQDFNAYETIMGQWFDLMRMAQAQSASYLREDVESYLVLLLMRFTERPELASVVLAEDYLHATQSSGRVQHEKMRDVADGCLLHAGFYPERSERKNVSPEYLDRKSVV